MEIEVDLRVGGKIQRPAGLGFGQETLVIGHMQPEFAALGDRTEAELIQIGGIEKSRHVGRVGDGYIAGVALPGVDRLGEGNVEAIDPRTAPVIAARADEFDIAVSENAPDVLVGMHPCIEDAKRVVKADPKVRGSMPT